MIRFRNLYSYPPPEQEWIRGNLNAAPLKKDHSRAPASRRIRKIALPTSDEESADTGLPLWMLRPHNEAGRWNVKRKLLV